jgi:hypothetical protein
MPTTLARQALYTPEIYAAYRVAGKVQSFDTRSVVDVREAWSLQKTQDANAGCRPRLPR